MGFWKGSLFKDEPEGVGRVQGFAESLPPTSLKLL